MIRSLEINNFRNISNIDLKFKNITVIVGKNDVGKTNILELINMLSVPSDLSRLIYLSTRRATDPIKGLRFLFKDGNFSEKISGKVEFDDKSGFRFDYKLESASGFNLDVDTPNFEFLANIDNKETYSLSPHIVATPSFPSLPPGVSVRTSSIELRQSPRPNAPKYMSFFVDNTMDAPPSGGFEEILSKIIEMGKKEELIQEINKILPFDLKDIMIVTSRGVEIYIQKENGIPVPFSLYGAGMRFVLKLIAVYFHLNALSSSLPKIILIDEIENGLHYSIKSKIWEFIFEKSNDVQFFITTHDEEFFRSLPEVSEEKVASNKNNFTAIRIDKKVKSGSEIFVPVYYDLALIKYGLKKNWEIRG